MQEISGVVLAVLGLAISSIAPLTALALGWGKAKLEEKAQVHKLALAKVEQDHAIATARATQDHQITTAYLDRALNQEVSLAIRQQLLRFLSTAGSGDTKLQSWAASELKRVDAVVEGLDRAIVDAEHMLHAANDLGQLATAERKLQLAVGRKSSAVDLKRLPPPTPAALRAGFFSRDKTSLVGINLEGEDLRGASLQYCNMKGANLRNARATNANFQGCDLRGATLDGAIVRGCRFFETDLRGASFAGTDLSAVDLNQARLDGADLSTATLPDLDVGAVYDDKTVWPLGYTPIECGWVLMDVVAPDGRVD